MKKLCCLLFILAVAATPLFSQELNARVQVQAPQVSNMNRKDLESIQNLIRDFLNTNKWTNETYLPQERIDCNIVIIINNWDGASSYKAEAQIQSSRPVYGSTYITTLLNMNDKDFDFTYSPGQSIDFSEQQYLSNLSSLLSYYAFTIIGLDKDSFHSLGGTSFFSKAQHILNMAQNGTNKGWKAVDGLRNRYWLNDNLMQASFRLLRTFNYNYHIQTLDVLQENQTAAVKKLIGYLTELQQMDKSTPGAIFPNIFFAAKADEMVNILSLGDPQDRIKGYNLITALDPANSARYEKLKP